MHLHNNCKLCGRPLKEFNSRRRGYGHTCFTRVMADKHPQTNSLLKRKKKYDKGDTEKL